MKDFAIGKSSVICDVCGSYKIFLFYLAQVPAYGVGSYTPANDVVHYTREELKLDAEKMSSSVVFHCISCNHSWWL